MDLLPYFLQRREVLYNIYLAEIWELVPTELLRQRPHPRANSIAWNIWHLARVEDGGINRLVADRPQVFDEADWLARLNIPWRHTGGGMSLAEVDVLSQQIDLAALQDYTHAVQQRTTELIRQQLWQDLESPLQAEQLRSLLVDEGWAHSNAEGLIQNYIRWSKGRCLMTFGLTHPFQHLGEIEVLAGLLGVDFE